jgi:hypothetical protein
MPSSLQHLLLQRSMYAPCGPEYPWPLVYRLPRIMFMDENLEELVTVARV